MFQILFRDTIKKYSAILFIISAFTLTPTDDLFADPLAYISERASNELLVFDTATNTVVGSIPLPGEPSNMGFHPDGMFVYVGTYPIASVTVVDTSTNAVTAVVPNGGDHSLLPVTNPSGTRVYVGNGRGNSAVVIDSNSNTVVATIPLGSAGGKPLFSGSPAIHPTRNLGYITSADGDVHGLNSFVTVFDTSTNTIITQIPLNGAHPIDIAIHPSGAFAYTADFLGTVSVIDTATNALVQTIPVAPKTRQVVFNPTGTRAYVSSDTGTLTVIDTQTHSVVTTVANAGSNGLGVHPAGTFVYVPGIQPNPGLLSVVDTTTNTIVDTVQAGAFIEAIIVAPDSSLGAVQDNYLLYDVKIAKHTPKFERRTVTLADQFDDDGASRRFKVDKVVQLGNPADMNGEDIIDPATHLVSYKIRREKGEPKHKPLSGVRVTNQFGEIILDTRKPDRLLVPSLKDLEDAIPDAVLPNPFPVEHFKCYKVKTTKGTPKFKKREVAVVDQFDQGALLKVEKPERLCNPADKNDEGIVNSSNHLLCYKVRRVKGEPKHEDVKGIHINNQFGPLQLDTKKEKELCVSSMKELLPL